MKKSQYICTDGGCHSMASKCCSGQFKSPAVLCSGCPSPTSPSYCCMGPGSSAVIY